MGEVSAWGEAFMHLGIRLSCAIVGGCMWVLLWLENCGGMWKYSRPGKIQSVNASQWFSCQMSVEGF